MLRTTLSKIKIVCSISNLPRILAGQSKHAQDIFTKNSIISCRTAKSTCSSNTGSQDDSNKSPNGDERKHNINQDNSKHNIVQCPNDNCEVCNRIISKIFGSENAAKPLEAATLHATVKDDDKLDQKVEKIEETSVVVNPKLQELNAPKVLQKQPIFNTAVENQSNDTSIYDSSYDEVASKALGTPSNEVDEFILKELRRHSELTSDLFPRTPDQWYYSESVYKPQQTMNLRLINPATGLTFPINRHMETLNMKESDFLDLYSSEAVRPLLLESVYADETSVDDILLERPDFETPLILNPYDNNRIFPLDGYIIREDVHIEPPVVQDSLAPTKASTPNEVGNREAMPPAEMEIETEHRGIRRELQGTMAGLSLGVPENISGTDNKSQVTECENSAYVYSQTNQTPTETPAEWQTQIGQHNDRHPVHPNSSISGKIPDQEKKRQQRVPDTAISSNQNLHDLYMVDNNLGVQGSDGNSLENPEHVHGVVFFNECAKDTIDWREVLKKNEQNADSRPKVESVAKEDPAIERAKDTQTIEANITATTGPMSNVGQGTEASLKEMLRRIRERSRLEMCRDLFRESTQFHMSTEACKPKTPFPAPCKPRPKEKPSQCPPPKKDDSKKDPCAKFALIGNQIYNSIYFARLFLNNSKNGKLLPIINYQSCKRYTQAIPAGTLNQRFSDSALDADARVDDDEIILVRDYEPWTPIPSWPIPEKKQKKQLVCPKDGCKLLPPPPLSPASKDKPCVSFPKKTFSLVDLFEHQALTDVRY